MGVKQGIKLWLQWVLASAIGWSSAGVLLGPAQLLVLRRNYVQVNGWVLASLGGLVSGALLIGVWIFAFAAYAIGGASYMPWEFVLFGVTTWVGAGALVGLLQQRAMQPQIARSRQWILASGLGFGLGLPIGYAVMDRYYWSWPFPWNIALIGATFGAMYGLITGGCLVWLFRQPSSQR